MKAMRGLRERGYRWLFGAEPVRPLAGHRQLVGVQRRWAMAAFVSVLIAISVAAAGWVIADHARPQPDTATRAALTRAAIGAVTEIMTFGPEHTDSPRAAVSAHLADPLRARYLADGADAIVPGAVGGRIRMSARVIAAGVSEYRWPSARLLVFVDQQVWSGDDPPATHTRVPVARWVLMRNVGGDWYMTDITSTNIK
ncbi:MAG: hypothetical protein QM673_17065 [Gordonia sp. (in: high G+C Gram-positive bacteria)]